MFKRITRTTTPLIAFAGGYLLFPKDWKKQSNIQTLNHFNEDVANKLMETPEFKKLEQDDQVDKFSLIKSFPSQHRNNYALSGILFGPNLMEIEPVIFKNESTAELTSFYHLGSELVSQDGQIHNGVVSTILDEGLCACGFAKLPSKKGVTASLSINFLNQAQPGSTVVLRAKVVEAKGRKVVIQGQLETFPIDGDTSKPLPIANAECILVEPKWFKYFKWLKLD